MYTSVVGLLTRMLTSTFEFFTNGYNHYFIAIILVFGTALLIKKYVFTSVS